MRKRRPGRVGGGVDRRGINPWHPRAVAYVYVLAMDLMCCFQGGSGDDVVWEVACDCMYGYVTVKKGGCKICFDSS